MTDQGIRYYDAHNHLHDARLAGSLGDVVETAEQAGIARMVVNGTHPGDWPEVLSLAERYPRLVQPSLGLHPWFAPAAPPDWRKELARLSQASGVAVGECGLDRWKPDLPYEGQEQAFVTQMRLAAELDRPLSIHCLRAWGRMLELLEKGPRPARGFLLHSYGGSAEMVDRFAALGAYFSFPGAFAREKKHRQRAAFERVPADRLLIETDAPDQMPPRSLIASPLADANHPANLAGIYGYVADILGWSLEKCAKQVEENFFTFFGAP